MVNNIISKKRLNDEIKSYARALENKKKDSTVYVIGTSFVLLMACLTLIFIYTFPNEYVQIFNAHGYNEKNPYIWIFLTSLVATFIASIAVLVFINVRFLKAHARIQIHLPILVGSKDIINKCAIIVGASDFIISILGAAAPIILGWHDADRAWYADTKILLFECVTAFIFLLWGIVLPLFYEKLSDRDMEYFKRYVYFEYDKIEEYIGYLQNVYKQRVKEFNEALSSKPELSASEKKNILFTPVKDDEPFSFDTRRVFRGHVSKYGSEYDIMKYILFIEIFTLVFEYDKNDEILKSEINDYIRVPNKDHAIHFNKKFYQFIQKIKL